jgi:hypothetical protein
MSGPLAHRPFRLLATGRAIDVLGNAMAPIALAFAVLDLGGSVSALGLVVAGFAVLNGELRLGKESARSLAGERARITSHGVLAGGAVRRLQRYPRSTSHGLFGGAGSATLCRRRWKTSVRRCHARSGRRLTPWGWSTSFVVRP